MQHPAPHQIEEQSIPGIDTNCLTARQMKDALARIGLVVSFSPFLDETSRYADFILPDALPLERWEDRHFPPTSPIAGWGVVQPCIQTAGARAFSAD